MFKGQSLVTARLGLPGHQNSPAWAAWWDPTALLLTGGEKQRGASSVASADSSFASPLSTYVFDLMQNMDFWFPLPLFRFRI